MRIYLDHAATTPLLPEAREAMARWSGAPSNPSSLHEEGRNARTAVDGVREDVAGVLGCLFGEIVFTSSGSEAANLAILGTALANENQSRNRILLGSADHHCVIHTRPILERLGFVVDMIEVESDARTSLASLDGLLGEDVLLVSVMHANNELGSVNPVKTLADRAHGVGSLFHTDAVQTFPESGTVDELGVDLLSLSAHKFNGPTGAGALYVRSGTPIKPVTVGGGQERDMRAGTENVAALAGMSAAMLWRANNPGFKDEVRTMRDVFACKLIESGFVPTVWKENSPADRLLPGHFHCRFPGVDADTMLIRLDRAGLSASSGAACSSGSLEPSHVLAACGYDPIAYKEGLRFTFGLGNTLQQVGEAANIVKNCLESILYTKGHG